MHENTESTIIFYFILQNAVTEKFKTALCALPILCSCSSFMLCWRPYMRIQNHFNNFFFCLCTEGSSMLQVLVTLEINDHASCKLEAELIYYNTSHEKLKWFFWLWLSSWFFPSSLAGLVYSVEFVHNTQLPITVVIIVSIVLCEPVKLPEIWLGRRYLLSLMQLTFST